MLPWIVKAVFSFLTWITSMDLNLGSFSKVKVSFLGKVIIKFLLALALNKKTSLLRFTISQFKDLKLT